MNTNHLSDIEIQQYAFDKENCASSIVDHIELCATCKIKAETYKLISSEIKNMEAPVFDFNLSGLVLSQIPKPEPKFSFSIFLVYLLVFVSVVLLCISIILLRTYLTNVFNNISPSFFYMVVLSAITVVVFQSIEMYKRYQNKMNMLNQY